MRLPVLSALILLAPLALAACSGKVDANIQETTGNSTLGDDTGTATGTDADGGTNDGGTNDGGTNDGGTNDGGTTTGDGGTTTGDGGTTGTGPLVAHGGKWVYDTVDVISTTCDPVVEFLPTASGEFYYLTDSDSSGFVKEIDALAESTVCSLGGRGAFSCDDIIGNIDVSDYGVVLPTTLITVGTLTSEYYMEGNYDITLDCSGDNCALAEAVYSISFPCTFDLDWTGHHESVSR